MRQQIIFLFMLAATAMSAQAHFDGNNIVIDSPVMPGQIDWQISLQNLDNPLENTYYWSDTGTDTLQSPYCNVRVSRTSFDSSLVARSEWSVDLKREPITIKASAMPNRKVKVEVSGGYQYELKIKHTTYGGWQTYMVGNYQFNPYDNIPDVHTGAVTAFVPFRQVGEQVAIVHVLTGGACDVDGGRLFYLN